MKNYFTLVLLLLLTFSVKAIDSKKIWYKNGELKAEVGFENGMFNGDFRSWYVNGQKKAEGKFFNNQRIGKWQLWDSLGTLRVVREYTDGFTFTTQLLKAVDGAELPLSVYPKYPIATNNLGEPDYPALEKHQILVFKDLWRMIDNTPENALLFQDNTVHQVISNYIDIEGNAVFDDYKFNHLLNIDSLRKIMRDPQMKIIGYRLYEGWNYFDPYQMSDYWIMGICPIVQHTTSGQKADLGWIRFNNLRGDLDAVVVKDSGGKVMTLDELIQANAFSSTIYKEANIYDRAIADYKKGDDIITEAYRIEFDIWDMEHEMWMRLTEE